MSGLYPIIRRVRRPLIIQDDDAPADAVAPREAVPVLPEAEVNYTKPPPKRERSANGREHSRRT
jgi:hypothetical protein